MLVVLIVVYARSVTISRLDNDHDNDEDRQPTVFLVPNSQPPEGGMHVRKAPLGLVVTSPPMQSRSAEFLLLVLLLVLLACSSSQFEHRHQRIPDRKRQS